MVLHVSVCFVISLMVSWTDAFTKSCDASLLTIKNVTECPTDKESYEKAANMKNCNSISESCKKGVQYHCVLNSELNGLVEVCATSIFVFGRACAKFDENLKGIIRVDGLECQNFSSPCPISYNSTETYKYPGCFDVRLTTVSTFTSTSWEILGRTKNSVISAQNDRQSGVPTVPIVLGVIFALFTVILAIFILRRKRKLCFKTGEDMIELQAVERDFAACPLLGKLQEEQILNEFDSTPNKYPAYKNVETREKSFGDCKISSIKDRAWDFARDGLYYEGYDDVTTCFHCGTQKGDWKEEADIHAEHLTLNQNCEFVKYVQLHILKTK